MYLTFSSFIGLCLSLWKEHFVEMWYQLTSTLAQLYFCIQAENSLRALLWELCMVLCMCRPRWWFVPAVHHLHFRICVCALNQGSHRRVSVLTRETGAC